MRLNRFIPGETSFGLAATVIVVLTGLVASACVGGSSSARDARGDQADGAPMTLRVVVSTTVIEDWVAHVGGDAVKVISLVPRGADAHTLQLTPHDIIDLVDADLIVLNGAGLEAGFREVVEENTEAPLLDLAAELELDAGAGDGQDSSAGVDPHYWLDAGHAITALDLIAAMLGRRAPSLAIDFSKNAAAYADLIAIADEEIALSLRGLPEAQRTLVTFHDAFGYFARRYDLEIIGFVVEGPEEEPSADDIADLVASMRQREVQVIFTEPQFSARVVEQVADETDSAIGILHSQLSEDAPTYLALLHANAAALTDPLTDPADRE